MSERKKVNSELNNQNKSESPEHIPLVPINIQLENEKKELRKKEKELRAKNKNSEPIITLDSGDVKYASQLNIYEQENEIIKCTLNPIYFIETYLTIFDQTQGVAGKIVPFKLFEFQKKLIKTYVTNRFVIANKYRQAGISTSTCAYIAWYIMFNENRSVAIVADKLETARDELMNDVVMFIESCPSWLRPKTGKEADNKYKDTQKLKRYDNESTLSAFSSKGLRGYTPTLLFWDETAWTEKNDKFWTAAKPTLQTGGSGIMVSTPAGLDPVFYKTFDGGRRGENNFIAVELWWFNDPRYNDELVWIKNKGKSGEIIMKDEDWDDEHRIKLMDDGWEASSPWFESQVRDANGDMKKIAQEILCSFLGSGDNFIAEDYLQRIEQHEIMTPIRQEYTDKNMWIFEDPEVDEKYIMTIDASPGHGEDNSTINMLKIKEFIEEKTITRNGKQKNVKLKRYKAIQVAEYYGKITPQLLAEIAYQYGKRYNDAYCVVDITGGYGVQSVEKLFEYGYENIHFSEVTHKPSRDRLQGYIKKGNKTMPDGKVINVDLIPGFFIGNNRPSVLLEMQRAIHLEDVIIRSIRLLNELKTFVTVAGNRVADHKRSFHDDSIMGLSIGLFVMSFDMARFRVSKASTMNMLNAIISNNDIQEIDIKKKREEALKKKREETIKKNSINGLQNSPYGVNQWLFAGIKRK